MTRPASSAPPRPRARAGDALRVPPALDAALALVGAESPEQLAAGVLQPLVALHGVRAGAVVRHGGAAGVVLASSGYACDTFAAGARLPLDSGLPVTESLRTGRPVLQGTGPSWVALPLRVGTTVTGALLLSLDGPLPDIDSVAGLTRTVAALAAALSRADDRARDTAALRVLEDGLEDGLEDAGCSALPGTELVVHARPWAGRLGGDVVACAAAPGGGWLLVADVSGRGPAAAPVAHALRAALRAAGPGCGDPTALLGALEAAVAPGAGSRGSEGDGDERFVTALVLRVGDGRVAVASAGHPPPLRVGPSGVTAVPVVPGLPLGAGLGPPGWTAGTYALGEDLLVCWTDGLLDRTHEVDLEAALAGAAGEGCREVVARLRAAADAVGPAQDDVSLAVLRLTGPPRPSGPTGR